MFGSEILEVATGVGALYLVLSLVCSAITEAVARAFATRSSTLRCTVPGSSSGSICSSRSSSFRLTDRLPRPNRGPAARLPPLPVGRRLGALRRGWGLDLAGALLYLAPHGL